ncbi:ROK family transcriptional regulator [Leifsonia poae]|uniref:ROK family transcriptional regulator n=1 Tax=Leifsonia poae TaxID=110933 RepID=UPI001CC0A75A|nr:ROK family transcriptional regulator [Leifsonia poae]
MVPKPVPGTPSWLRETNDRTALSLLLEHGVLTRSRIGELSGLSKPTAAQMVSRLENAGLIHAVGEVSGGRGPNAASYAVRTDRMLGVAIDIDYHEMRSTVVDASGHEHPIATTPLARTARDRSPAADVRSAIDAACEAAGIATATVSAVCIGVQGALDPRTDELSFIETLPGWPKKGIRKHLEDALGLSVHIDNDVNLAAIAERTDGAGRDTGGFALLWMGDGLGLSVDQGGSVHRGASGGAGEIGYLPIPRNAAELDPAADDLQDLIGGPTVARLARGLGMRGRGYAALIDAVPTAPEREALLAELAPRVAVGVIPVLALLDPELVVLGGPTGSAGGERLAELVGEQLRKAWGSSKVVTTGVPVHPVLRGAREHLLTEVRTALFAEVSRISA